MLGRGSMDPQGRCEWGLAGGRGGGEGGGGGEWGGLRWGVGARGTAHVSKRMVDGLLLLHDEAEEF